MGQFDHVWATVKLPSHSSQAYWQWKFRSQDGCSLLILGTKRNAQKHFDTQWQNYTKLMGVLVLQAFLTSSLKGGLPLKSVPLPPTTSHNPVSVCMTRTVLCASWIRSIWRTFEMILRHGPSQKSSIQLNCLTVHRFCTRLLLTFCSECKESCSAALFEIWKAEFDWCAPLSSGKRLKSKLA